MSPTPSASDTGAEVPCASLVANSPIRSAGHSQIPPISSAARPMPDAGQIVNTLPLTDSGKPSWDAPK